MKKIFFLQKINLVSQAGVKVGDCVDNHPLQAKIFKFSGAPWGVNRKSSFFQYFYTII